MGFAAWFLQDDSPPAGHYKRMSDLGFDTPEYQARPAGRAAPGPQPNPKRQASSPGAAPGPAPGPMRRPGFKTARTMMDEAASRLKPGTKFFDQEVNTYSQGGQGSVSPTKGFQGNVSPVTITPQRGEAEKSARSARQTSTKSRPRNSSSSTRSRVASPDVEDCVERPEGDCHGPGRWRGKWFKWCDE